MTVHGLFFMLSQVIRIINYIALKIVLNFDNE